MAKRKMLFHPDYVREKIRANQLINRLHKCAFGEISLTTTQLRAIEILLRKSIPDLAAAEIKSDVTHRSPGHLRLRAGREGAHAPKTRE
jgi:hypothetical protein